MNRSEVSVQVGGSAIPSANTLVVESPRLVAEEVSNLVV